MARYDYGLRGSRQTAPARSPIRTRYRGPAYDRELRRGYDPYEGIGYAGMRNRVTAAYNLDYVFPEPPRNERNYASFGGDVEQRVGDMRSHWGRYETTGGTRTWRGRNPPVGWERGYDRGFYSTYRGRYDTPYR